MLLRAGPWSRLVTPPTVEPLTVDEGKLWCGFDWPAGDPREALMTTVIAASRGQVEDDTALVLLPQTRETLVDGVTGGAVVLLPAKCRPAQRIVSVTWLDQDGHAQDIDPTWYALLPGLALLTLFSDVTWPSTRLVIQVVAGWPTKADLLASDPRLVHLVGRLVAHNMTLGRDLAISGTIVVAIPMGYHDEIQPYRAETVA